MINDSYLDPDIHLWPECPDDRCYHCGYVFPADWEIEEDTPQWEGFCCQACMEGYEKREPAHCIMPMQELLTNELGRDDPAGWSKSIYKGTDCGAWLKVTHDSVRIGSIVEGSDVEVEPRDLVWPFTAKKFWDAVQSVDDEAKFYWDRDNSIWFVAKFEPIGKPVQHYHGKYCWGELEWFDTEVPDYVRNKTADYFENGGDLDTTRYVGICLGLSLGEYINDMTY